jgi:large subunit ribosomal protein L31
MKADIHPNYMQCTVTCVCGASFDTLSGSETLKLDICNKCHPFYTGTQKLMDTEGRVERFRKKYGMQTSS